MGDMFLSTYFSDMHRAALHEKYSESNKLQLEDDGKIALKGVSSS